MEVAVTSKTCTVCGKEFSECMIAIGECCYHPSCFVCSVCNCHLEENQFSIKNKVLYCKKCYAEKFRKRCAVCHQLILDNYHVEAMGQFFHTNHFVCFTCKQPFSDNKYLKKELYFEQEKRFYPFCGMCSKYIKKIACHSCGSLITGCRGYDGYNWYHEDCLKKIENAMSVPNKDDVVSNDSVSEKEVPENNEETANVETLADPSEQQQESLTNEEKEPYEDEENQGMEKQEEVRKEAEWEEAERIEAERKEAERKEAERKEAERREVERKEAERKEAERREAERKETEQRAAESRRSFTVISDDDEEPSATQSRKSITFSLRKSYAPIHQTSSPYQSQASARNSIFESLQHSDYRRKDEEKQEDDTMKENSASEEEEELKRHISQLPNNQLPIYPYDVLITIPYPKDVDVTRREYHLSDEDFQRVFNMTKAKFETLPKWRRNQFRKDHGLFYCVCCIR